jgi:poly(A) polymerase
MQSIRALKRNAAERAAAGAVRELRRAGHEAYFAGGCVRDMLLGLAPREFDIATSARPEEVMKIFPRSLAVGKAFGVVLVRRGGARFEVATFRRDMAYRDGRRPEAVAYARSAREDARRRDFTVNGMFYDPLRRRLFDFVGGRADLRAGVLRCIGAPERRFGEDHLRLLRAVRFAARFGFSVEPRTWAALKRQAPKIALISAERVRDELAKMLLGPAPQRALDLMAESGLLKVILPEADAMRGVAQPPQFHPEGDVYTHVRLMLELFAASRRLRSDSSRVRLGMSVLMHDIGKPPTFQPPEPARGIDRIRFDGHCELGAKMCRSIMERLRFPRSDVEAVAAVTRDHLKFMSVFEMRPATLKRFLREPHFPLLLELHRLDCLGCHGKLDAYRFCLRKRREFAREKSLVLPRLATGADLIAMGLRPGPRFKELLSSLETEQLEGRVRNREEALSFLQKAVKNF